MQVPLKKDKNGKIIKLNLNVDIENFRKDQDNVFEKVLVTIEGSIPNNHLWIMTVPTRNVKIGYNSKFEPGHNWSGIKNEKGEIEEVLSLRPDTTISYGECNVIEDPRFPNRKSVTLYKPRFTSQIEEIKKWMNDAITGDTPLFIHVVPLDIGINGKKYKETSSQIKEQSRAYSLLSYYDERTKRLIKPNNCNAVTEEAVITSANGDYWGDYIGQNNEDCDFAKHRSVYDLMIRKFVDNKSVYEGIAKSLDLTTDEFFETPKLKSNQTFEPVFLC